MSPVWLLSCFFLGSFLKVNHLGGQIWNACLYFYTENTGIYCFSCCVKLDIIDRNKKWPLILPTYPTGYSDWESCLLKLLLRPKAVKDAKLHNSSKRNAVKNISIGFIAYHVNHLNIPSCSSIHSDWLLGHLQLIAICIKLSCLQLSFTALQLSLKCFIAPIALSTMSNRKWMGMYCSYCFDLNVQLGDFLFSLRAGKLLWRQPSCQFKIAAMSLNISNQLKQFITMHQVLSPIKWL